MRKVTCGDCGRQYDYEEDNFCPKCGSYSPPENNASTRVELELLSRFGDGRNNQKRVAPVRQQGGPSRTVSRRPQPAHRSGPSATADHLRAAHMGRCSACENPTDRPGGGRMLFATTIILIICITAALMVFGQSDRLLPRPVVLHSDHAMGESFTLNEVQFTVDSLWWVPLNAAPSVMRAGYDCLALDVFIEGGAPQDNLAIATPYLLLPDGTQFQLEDDATTSYKLKSCGVYDVNLQDYQWEDPLIGQFVFFLPTGTAGEATLVLDEYLPGHMEDPSLSAIHSISLRLP